MRSFFAALAFVASMLSALPAWAAPAADGAADLKSLVGGHARVVWAQDQGDGADYAAKGGNLLLMALDTDDGKGERVVMSTPANYYRPFITRRGDRIVYSDQNANKVYVMNWDGTGHKQLLDGCVAAAMWIDPKTGVEWAYVEKGGRNKASPMWRYQIDKPEVGELVYDKTEKDTENWQLSADGTRAAAMFPWPRTGIAVLPNGSWTQYGEGCCPGLAPDDSYLFWQFDGTHRNIVMHDTKNGGKRAWKVNIGGAPGINGGEVYHPRWSNHARFIVVTGPYLGSGHNLIAKGSKVAEVYVGKFRDDFQAIEKWAKVTANDKGDFQPDLWVESAFKAVKEPTSKPAAPVASTTTKPAGAAETSQEPAWPGSHDNLVFLWDGTLMSRIVDKDGNSVRDCRALPRDRALIGTKRCMDLRRGGAFLAQDVDSPLLEACRKRNQLTVEAVITPANITQGGPARIIAFSSGQSSCNFMLAQEGDKLLLHLRTSGRATDAPIEVCKLQAGKASHVIVSYFTNRLMCYVDGTAVATKTTVSGDFSAWTPQHLLFGDEWDRGKTWLGQLEGVAIYSRFIGADEAAKKAAAYQQILKARKPLPRAVVEAKLVKAVEVPQAPAAGAPRPDQYTSALIAHVYEVQKVIDGQIQDKRIMVYHWAMLDLKVLPEITKLKEGGVYRLTLEQWDDHPEWQGARSFLPDEILPAFYAAGE